MGGQGYVVIGHWEKGLLLRLHTHTKKYQDQQVVLEILI